MSFQTSCSAHRTLKWSMSWSWKDKEAALSGEQMSIIEGSDFLWILLIWLREGICPNLQASLFCSGSELLTWCSELYFDWLNGDFFFLFIDSYFLSVMFLFCKKFLNPCLALTLLPSLISPSPCLFSWLVLRVINFKKCRLQIYLTNTFFFLRVW